MKDNICILPWISIEATPIGTVRPCCLAKEEITDEHGKHYKISEDTIDDIFNSNYMIELREQFLKGEKPKTCQRCWDEENSGRASKRINSKIRLSDMINGVDFSKTTSDNLIFLDLKLGNICNLKCRICGSWSSSKWVKEEVDYVPKEYRKQHQAYQFLKQGAWPRESEKFWNEIEVLLPKIRYLEFTGGEPFLIDQHFNLLERAVDLGYSKQIEIHYNTNGTVFPAKHHLWKWFKHVEIAFSIDNTEERFEYERYGAKWDEVQENIRKFNDMRSNKLSTQLCWTANIQNVYYLPEICNWIKQQTFDHVFFNMLHDPWMMNIARMTERAKSLVIDRLRSHEFNSRFRSDINRIIRFIENGPGSDGAEFILKMRTTDEYRGQNFLDTHPEIARAMGYA